MVVLIPLILSIGIISALKIDDVHAVAYFPPPLKQIANGIDPQNVTCTEALELVLRISDNSPACVKPSSVEKLISRGWAIEQIDLETDFDSVEIGDSYVLEFHESVGVTGDQ